MDAAWPPSSGEAIHTSTFLGHPVGCAMALANIKEIARLNLPAKAAENGKFLLRELKRFRSAEFEIKARGLGLMAGLELVNKDGSPATTASLAIIKNLLPRGFIFLPEGEHANVISFSPPLVITESQLQRSLRALRQEIGQI
jgi:4-aminobutyrate aminotransferase-like enzyme